MRRTVSIYSELLYNLLLVLPISIFSSFPVWAAQNMDDVHSDSDTPIIHMDESVVTATRTQRPVTGIAGAVTVIPREELEKQATLSRSLTDVLGKVVPGLAVGSQSLSNTGQTLRGRNALILIDGVPQSTIRNAARDLNTIDPSAIERIEVVRGATSIYGDGATGGIIQIFTKKPGDGKPTFTTDILANTAPTNPTAGLGGRVAQSAAGKHGWLDYSLSGSYEHVGGLFDARGDRIPPDLLSAQGGLADYEHIISMENWGSIWVRSACSSVSITITHSRIASMSRISLMSLRARR